MDFYYAQTKLVVEVDGDSHFAPESQAHNAERTAHLEHQGLRILRFINAEVMESLEGVYRQIEQAPLEKKPCASQLLGTGETAGSRLATI